MLKSTSEMLEPITKDISLRKLVYNCGAFIWCSYAAPNKGTTIWYWFRSPKTVLNPPVNGHIQGLFKAFECFPVLFKANLIFKDFQDSPVYSSTFQACANHGMPILSE